MSTPSAARDIADLLRWYTQAPTAVAELPAFTFYRAEQRRVQLGYRELVAAVDQAASALAGRHGVKRGDRVAVLMANGERTPVVLLAIMALGAVAVPLNPGSESGEWVFAATDCGAVGAVVSDALRPLADVLDRALSFVCTDSDLAAQEAQAAAPLGHGLYLHLPVDGSARLRITNAGGNDP